MSAAGKRLALKKAIAESANKMEALKLTLVGQPVWAIASQYAAYTSEHLRRLDAIRLTP